MTGSARIRTVGFSSGGQADRALRLDRTRFDLMVIAMHQTKALVSLDQARMLHKIAHGVAAHGDRRSAGDVGLDTLEDAGYRDWLSLAPAEVINFKGGIASLARALSPDHRARLPG